MSARFESAKRTEYTSWSNPEPISELHEALDLLMIDTRTDPAYLTSRFDAGGRIGERIWEIVVPWYSHGDSGGDTSGLDYFQIDQELAKRFVEEGLVGPRTRPQWGHTEVLKNELVPTKDAKRLSENFGKEMREVAEALLKPGVHTDLTGKPDYAGSRREEWRYGRLYVQFRLPGGGMCKVYPDTREIVMPEPEASAAE